MRFAACFAALLLATPAAAQLFPRFERNTLAPELRPAPPAKPIVPDFALPDPTMTPGAIDRAVTAAVFCNRTTKERRSVSAATKAAVLAAYNIPESQSAGYEIDHLVPIAIGGANTIANLWPQPWPEADVKDRLEVELQRLACVAYRTLQPAEAAAVLAQEQREIAEDWVAAARRHGILRAP